MPIGSNMGTAIQIRGLSKKYLLRAAQDWQRGTLVETLSSKASHLRDVLLGRNNNAKKVGEEFWALKDVSWDIEEGERIGIVGRNGAGKSTLLKILSKITEPTEGIVKIRGRLSSLLEVGTGFHQELTGRENIFLNGAILGMSKQEIVKKFDEIVAFAEIEPFLDTPVKRFSSGMYMRLGFSIAAHLDSDILVIDEVLAVGDTQFQEKCFKKLDEMGAKGRTVIYVSHDLGSVLSLCDKGIYLDKGHIRHAGSIDECVSEYMKNCRQMSLSWEGVAGDEHIKIHRVHVDGNKEFFYQGEKPRMTIEYEILKPHPDLFMSVSIWNLRHQELARAQTYDNVAHHDRFMTTGPGSLSFTLDAGLFHQGDYLVKLHCAICNRKKISDEEIILRFPVYVQSTNTRFSHANNREGIMLGDRWDWN